MKILITGARGLVGGVITRHLKELSKYDIYTTGQANMRDSCNHIICDISNMDAFHVFYRYEFDVIIHCAAMIPTSFEANVDDIGECNRKMDDNIIKLAQQSNSKVIFISSTSVYEEQNNVLSEDTPVNANNSYTKNKLLTEELLARYFPDNYYCLRITSPYGCEQKNNNVIKLFMDNAFNGKPLGYYGEGTRTQNFIDARDIALVIEKVLINEKPGIYNIASSSSVSMRELAEIIARYSSIILGKSIVVSSINNIDSQEIQRINVSIEKAKNKLGWEPKYPVSEGINHWMLAKVKR